MIVLPSKESKLQTKHTTSCALQLLVIGFNKTSVKTEIQENTGDWDVTCTSSLTQSPWVVRIVFQFDSRPITRRLPYLSYGCEFKFH